MLRVRDVPLRELPDRDPDELDRDFPREALLRAEPERVLRDVVARALREEPEPELDRDDVRFPLEPPERVDRRERRRVVLARRLRGISARTTSLTRRPSSASRNLAIRSSSRRIPRAS